MLFVLLAGMPASHIALQHRVLNFWLLWILIMSCMDKLLAGLQVNHEDFNEGIIQVQSKKKANLNYYA